jgi:hypothetical protein
MESGARIIRENPQKSGLTLPSESFTVEYRQLNMREPLTLRQKQKPEEVIAIPPEDLVVIQLQELLTSNGE